jgi:mycothiol synthase
VNVLVLGELDADRHADLAALLTRSKKADGHPALAEPQRIAVARRDLGADGTRVVMAYADDRRGDLLGCAVLSPAPDGSTTVHVAIDPDHRAGDEATSIRTALVTRAETEAPGPIRLWKMRATSADDDDVAPLGFHPERDVVQMRVPLPLPRDTVGSVRPVVTRAFVPGQDDEAWLSINNRAFADHPEQGGWTHEQLQARLEADWFDAAGFLVADDPDGPGLIGSCWTKIHHEGGAVLGEIYVISVDPDRAGKGWGRALTVAGLEWMAGQGVRMGMLYTDASNTTAVALYHSLGFEVDHVDRAYLR